MKFNTPFGGSIEYPEHVPQIHWTRTWPQEDGRLTAIKALVDSAPTYKRGAAKTPEAAILVVIREVLKENR